MRYLAWIKIILAVWLIFSGLILGFNEVSIANWNNGIIGLALIFITLFELTRNK